MLRRCLVPLLVAAIVLPIAVGAPACMAGNAIVRVTSSSGIDRALNVAKAKGPGTTVYFKAGSYTHSRMSWPNGINLRGDGIGKTKLNFSIKFGSRSSIGGSLESMGLTIGSTSENTRFSLRDGAHDTRFGWVRFRSRGLLLWDITDFTDSWRDPVVKRSANAHDVVWADCEFEYTGDPAGTTFNIWWDAREGGGNVYDLTWKRSTFGAKDSSGQFGSGMMGMLIQPSPPEHAPDGPRPPTVADPGGIRSTDFSFDFSQVTHGSGLAATSGGAGYGFRIWDSSFVGRASFTSIDVCDYIRAWAMVRYRLTNPDDVTLAMIAAAPDRVTTKGIDLRDVWLAGELRREYGRHVAMSAVSTEQGTSVYHVRAAVRRHDRQLYGF